MKPEIEIYENQDEIVEFGVGDTCFRVCIETENYWVDEPDGYNSFTDQLMYKEYYVKDIYVKMDTLEIEGELLYTPEEICGELERILNL
jgi:hypothetical protein